MPIVGRYSGETTAICATFPLCPLLESSPSRNSVLPNPPKNSGTVLESASGLHARRGLGCFKRAAFKLFGARRLIVQRAYIKRQHSKIVRVKARIHLMGIAQAHQEESGAYKRDEANAYLQRDKNVADVEARALAQIAAGPLFEF